MERKDYISYPISRQAGNSTIIYASRKLSLSLYIMKRIIERRITAEKDMIDYGSKLPKELARAGDLLNLRE